MVLAVNQVYRDREEFRPYRHLVFLSAACFGSAEELLVAGCLANVDPQSCIGVIPNEKAGQALIQASHHGNSDQENEGIVRCEDRILQSAKSRES